jgi:hypothetical protein
VSARGPSVKSAVGHDRGESVVRAVGAAQTSQRELCNLLGQNRIVLDGTFPSLEAEENAEEERRSRGRQRLRAARGRVLDRILSQRSRVAGEGLVKPAEEVGQRRNER